MNNNNKTTKNPLSIEKWRLAKLMGISQSTLQNWINETEFDKLKELGYNKNQKILFQRQLDYLFPSGIDLEMK